MKKTIAGLFTLAVLATMTATELDAQQGRRGQRGNAMGPQVAQRGPQGPRGGGVESLMKLQEELELTDDQLAQLDALRVASVGWRNGVQTRMNELRSELGIGEDLC